MQQIGTILKKARLGKGYSIKELNEKTKIRVKYIESIESNNWNALPGSTYAHGFIKRYAEVVDLDPKKVHALFRREYSSKEQHKIIPDGMIDKPLAQPSIVLTIRGWIAKLIT